MGLTAKVILLALTFLPACCSNTTQSLRSVKVVDGNQTNSTSTDAVLLNPLNVPQLVQAAIVVPGRVNTIVIKWPSAGVILRHMALVAAISTTAAYIFRIWVKWPDVDESAMAKEKLSSWSSGPFDCFQDMPTCCWTFWCPGVRWAANLDILGFLTFWFAFALFLVIELLAMIPFGGCCCCAWIAVLTYYRNKFRVAFGMSGANEFTTICGDCVFVSCCTCCAIAQEARHVEMAATVNHEATASQRPLLPPAQEAVPA